MHFFVISSPIHLVFFTSATASVLPLSTSSLAVPSSVSVLSSACHENHSHDGRDIASLHVKDWTLTIPDSVLLLVKAA